jgi:hypothetical protein
MRFFNIDEIIFRDRFHKQNALNNDLNIDEIDKKAS